MFLHMATLRGSLVGPGTEFFRERRSAFKLHHSPVPCTPWGDPVQRSYEANGNGGKLRVVMPELELAVVLTGGKYGQGGIWSRWRQEIVGDATIRAIRGVANPAQP
jgi:hypothetical protein